MNKTMSAPDHECVCLECLFDTLVETLDAMATQRRCGCGHQACDRCLDDAQCVRILAMARRVRDRMNNT